MAGTIVERPDRAIVAEERARLQQLYGTRTLRGAQRAELDAAAGARMREIEALASRGLEGYIPDTVTQPAQARDG